MTNPEITAGVQALLRDGEAKICGYVFYVSDGYLQESVDTAEELYQNGMRQYTSQRYAISERNTAESIVTRILTRKARKALGR